MTGRNIAVMGRQEAAKVKTVSVAAGIPCTSDVMASTNSETLIKTIASRGRDSQAILYVVAVDAYVAYRYCCWPCHPCPHLPHQCPSRLRHPPLSCSFAKRP